MKKKILTIGIVFFLFLSGWVLYENKALQVTQYEINCGANPNMSGFTIVQISDLHNELFGENQKTLLGKVAGCNPDIIVITGDFIDCRNPNVDVAMEFIRGAIKMAPVYYVPGNHERWAYEKYQELCAEMENAGVHLLAGNQEKVLYNNAEIILMGVEDPDFCDMTKNKTGTEFIREKIQQFDYVEEEFTILLSHRPELFSVYEEEKLDLILTGHAHGGQFRLPWIGGLAAPNQGLFPKYDAGTFIEGNTCMIVSRGIGNSIIPIRFNNPPEIVVVKLSAK